tara:strand:+ start:187 stop:357 length:171 start_codon:yes stop_codon:yes gene_type:complete
MSNHYNEQILEKLYEEFKSERRNGLSTWGISDKEACDSAVKVLFCYAPIGIYESED